MNPFIQQVMQNMDEDTARNALSNLSEDDIAQAVNWAFSEMVVPHLDEIRQRANNDVEVERVRQRFESMTEDEREEAFYSTLDELVATLVLCRERPVEGFADLKPMLRDPYTQEALLLLFHNDQHIDREYTDQLKDFTAAHLHWVGAMLFPEMYDDDEVDEVLSKFNLEHGNGESATPGG